MVAVRMRVTGHRQADIEAALRQAILRLCGRALLRQQQRRLVLTGIAVGTLAAPGAKRGWGRARHRTAKVDVLKEQAERARNHGRKPGK